MKTFELYNRLCSPPGAYENGYIPFHSEQDWINNATEAQERELVEACAREMAPALSDVGAPFASIFAYLHEMALKGCGK